MTYNGETKSLADMCRKHNLPYSKISYMVLRGISFSDAIKKYKREIQEAAKGKSENEPKEGLFGEE